MTRRCHHSSSVKTSVPGIVGTNGADHTTRPSPCDAADSHAARCSLHRAEGAVGAEPEQQGAPLEPLEPGLAHRGARGQRDRRERDREHWRRPPAPTTRATSSVRPRPSARSIIVTTSPANGMVERELGRHVPPAGVGAPLVPVEAACARGRASSNMRPLACSHLHLVERPVEVLVVLALERPSRSRGRSPGARRRGGRASVAEAQVLQVAWSPPTAGRRRATGRPGSPRRSGRARTSGCTRPRGPGGARPG